MYANTSRRIALSLATRSAPTARVSMAAASKFHSSAASYLQVGDSIPSITLQEGSPGNTVDLAEETSKGKYIIVGVPGAFSPACSASHVPGYISKLGELKSKGGIDGVFVVAVNDAFVTKAWGESLQAPESVSIISFSSKTVIIIFFK